MSFPDSGFPEISPRRMFLSRIGAVAAVAVVPLVAHESGSGAPPAQDASRQKPTQDQQKARQDPCACPRPQRRRKPGNQQNFQRYVTRKLEELTNLTAEDGPIRSQVLRVQKSLSEIQGQLDQCNRLVGDHNEIASVQQTLNEIKRALELA